MIDWAWLHHHLSRVPERKRRRIRKRGPCDIPNGHWIDVRVNMPSNLLYNQKQAEAERLAKLEAERLAEEEAKRVAEEAGSAEQEAAEQVEQQ
ncbi:hypothetical protein RHA65_00010 [Providencia rettgeri]|nr:hypothetical protein [Providencia rettgeri]